MPQPFKYHAFISYSHADARWGDWLHKALETYPIPKRLVGRKTATGTIPKRLAPIFRDRDELPSAHDLGSKVEQALSQSAALIVICSPRSASSRWVNEEITAFKRMGHADRVFCLIVDGEPNASDIPGREVEECFAPALRFELDTHGTPTAQRAEPIAADARPGKDGKAGAKLKLLSGLLDVGFDELRQREQQRRVRRLTAIAALALVMMTVTSVLAVQAVIARKAADVARQAAERRQQQSEDLIGYMLGDLNDKLDEVGRLDIMQGVDDKAMAYFAALPSSDVTDTALDQRATALQKIANVRLNLGNTEAAREAYRVAAQINAQRVAQSPEDLDRKAAYAKSLSRLGLADWYQDDLVQASQNFSKASDMMQAVAILKPEDKDLAFNLAGTRTNFGRILEARGSDQEAKEQYDKVLKIFEVLNAKNPGEARWKEELGYAHNNLGKLAYEQGDLEQAVARYRDDWRLKSALVADQPKNQQWRSELAVSSSIYAGVLVSVGDVAAAGTHAMAAVDSGKALADLDPNNAIWQDYLALYRMRLADLSLQKGTLSVAGEESGKALETLNALAAKAPDTAGLLPDLAKAELTRARWAWSDGHAADAGKLATSALQRMQALLSKRADDRTNLLLATQAECLLGDLAGAGHDATARKHWRKARDYLAPLADTSGNPEILDSWVRVLLRLGERETAARPIEKLQKMGYRNLDFVALLRQRGIAYPRNEAIEKRIAELTR